LSAVLAREYRKEYPPEMTEEEEAAAELRPEVVEFPTPKDQEAQIVAAFETFDEDGSGEIDAAEMRAAIKALGMETRKDQIRALVKEIDVDGNGEIDIDEFKTIFDRLKDVAEGQDALRKTNRKAFKLLDENRNSRLEFEEVRRAALQLGENFTDQEMRAIFTWADKDGDGYLSEVEFMDAITPALHGMADPDPEDEETPAPVVLNFVK